MSWQSDIAAALNADTALVSVVGDNITWDVADGTTAPPYLVIQTISGQGETDFSGVRNLTFPLIQLTAWAKTRQQAIIIAALVKSAIEGRNLPGSANASLGYAGENTTYDEQTELCGEIIEFRVSANTN